MRILVTGDHAGGVGVHARTLAVELAQRGHCVALAEIGTGPPGDNPPLSAGVAYLHLPYALEWRSELPVKHLEEAAQACAAALNDTALNFRPDLLHSNHFSLAGCLPGIPTLLGVHSDVVSWWRAVHRCMPPATPFHSWYRRQVQRALLHAHAIVVPSLSASRDLAASYGFAGSTTVIPNGTVDPGTIGTSARAPYAVCLGRLWDAGKQIQLLLRTDLGMRLVLAGDAGDALPGLPAGVAWRGQLGGVAAARLLARAAVYIAPSRYEPFGLAPLEAAAHGCALLLNDIASFREIWGGDACYFMRDNGDDLARQLRSLAAQPERRRQLARAAQARVRRRYGAAVMAARYAVQYAELVRRARPPLSASSYGA